MSNNKWYDSVCTNYFDRAYKANIWLLFMYICWKCILKCHFIILKLFEHIHIDIYPALSMNSVCKCIEHRRRRRKWNEKSIEYNVSILRTGGIHTMKQNQYSYRNTVSSPLKKYLISGRWFFASSSCMFSFFLLSLVFSLLNKFNDFWSTAIFYSSSEPLTLFSHLNCVFKKKTILLKNNSNNISK